MTASRSIIFIGLAFLGTVYASQPGESRPLQRVPAKALGMTSPLNDQQSAALAGRKLFQRDCAQCHGAEREGLGKAPPLARPEVMEAKPGALFWVLQNGSIVRGMPSFARLPAAQRWQIVAFLRMAE